jgi:uncharacterized membrane protein
MRFRPIHGILLVLAFMGLVWAAEWASDGGFNRKRHVRVRAEADRTVRIDTAEFKPLDVRFYRYLSAGNQEVKFLVGRDGAGHLHATFDANELCAKTRRGYRAQGEWLVCNKCEKAFRLAEVDANPGGCWPVTIAFRLEGSEVVMTEDALLTGWRLFV